MISYNTLGHPNYQNIKLQISILKNVLKNKKKTRKPTK